MENLVTVREYSEKENIPIRTLYDWIKKGRTDKVNFIKLAGRILIKA